MEDLIRVMVEPLLEQPESLHFETETVEDEITITIHVAESDIGRVIGKGGKVINAIRTVVKAAAIKKNLRVFVEVV
ncbi:KH domain-containing protein [Guggenheimella bovis]